MPAGIIDAQTHRPPNACLLRKDVDLGPGSRVGRAEPGLQPPNPGIGGDPDAVEATTSSGVTVGSASSRARACSDVPATYVRDHVELAYATTVYGAQGHTMAAGHLLVGEHTGAAAAYVGMTRGRETNIAHLVADNLADARDQGVATCSRDRADLGPAHAAHLASVEAATYATGRPAEAVLIDLLAAWTMQADLTEHIAQATSVRDDLALIVPLRAQTDPPIDQLRATEAQARADCDQARARLKQTEAAITTAATTAAADLHQSWDQAYPNAARAAERIRAGTGRFGRGRAQVNTARQDLTGWASAWRPIVADVTGLPVEALLDPDRLATAMPYNATSALHSAISRYAEHTANLSHPELEATRQAIQVADQQVRHATHARTAAEDAQAHRFDELGLGDLAYTNQPG